jgi:hypothetical protein
MQQYGGNFPIWSAPSNYRTTGLCNPFVGNGSVNTFPRIGPCYATRWLHQQYRLCFPWGLCRVLIREVNLEASSVQGSWKSFRVLVEFWGSRVIEQEMARRLHSDLKWYVSVLISVARRRLVETENPSACATESCKVCRSAEALY